MKLNPLQRATLGAILRADQREGFWWAWDLPKATRTALVRRGLIEPANDYTYEGEHKYWKATTRGRVVYESPQLDGGALLDLVVALTDALPALKSDAGRYNYGDESAKVRYEAALAALRDATKKGSAC